MSDDPAGLARRTILISAVEEDAILDLLKALRDGFGETRDAWLAEIASVMRAGLAEGYVYGPDEVFAPVSPEVVARGDIGGDYNTAVHLSRTEATVDAILRLPHPAADDPLRAIGLWR